MAAVVAAGLGSLDERRALPLGSVMIWCPWMNAMSCQKCREISASVRRARDAWIAIQPALRRRLFAGSISLQCAKFV